MYVHIQIICAHTDLSYTKNSTLILYCHLVHRTNYFRCHPYFTPQTLPRPPSSFYTVIRGVHIHRLGSHHGGRWSNHTASPNLSDLAECVILCTSWLQSPGKVYCRTVNIWVTLVELRGPILSAQAGHQLSIYCIKELFCRNSPHLASVNSAYKI